MNPIRKPGLSLKKPARGPHRAVSIQSQPPVKPPKRPGPRKEEETNELIEKVGKAAGQIGFTGLAAILGAPYAVAIWIKVYVLGIGHVPGPSGDERV